MKIVYSIKLYRVKRWRYPGCAYDFCNERMSWRTRQQPKQGEDKPSPLLRYEQVATSSIVGAMACPRPGALQKSYAHPGIAPSVTSYRTSAILFGNCTIEQRRYQGAKPCPSASLSYATLSWWIDGRNTIIF